MNDPAWAGFLAHEQEREAKRHLRRPVSRRLFPIKRDEADILADPSLKTPAQVQARCAEMALARLYEGTP